MKYKSLFCYCLYGKPNSEINLTSQIKRDRKSTTYLQLEYRIMFQKQHFYELLFFILRIFVKQYEMYFNYNEQIPNHFFFRTEHVVKGKNKTYAASDHDLC